ncbi:DUF4142 domain-containing protein [Streptomyces monomycini]|uniref:DUF4142 domain-containing protein n=1 Tax=Streptomyces monomycini TaxID=371720 RepID=UPI00067CA73C|nr:DUF4142 domain-containing protein [Streptomyces monomycini]
MRSVGRRRSVTVGARSRFSVGTGLVVAGLSLTAVAILLPVQLFASSGSAADNSVPAARNDGLGVWNTPSGPLTPLDREFVTKVRQAGLWELPAGRQALQRGKRQAVQHAGRHLAEGHTDLNQRAADAARALAVTLPGQPTPEQQGWLAQLDTAEGDTYERLFVNLARRAHGKVFSLVAQVRANTRNAVIRDLATRANTVVLDHITALEQTGLVDFGALDGGPASGGPGTATVAPPPAK